MFFCCIVQFWVIVFCVLGFLEFRLSLSLFTQIEKLFDIFQSACLVYFYTTQKPIVICLTYMILMHSII